MRKHITYISPSILPSRAANSIHVINQCNALAKEAISLDLFVATTLTKLSNEDIRLHYGIDLHPNINLIPIHLKFNFAVQVQIAVFFILHYLYHFGPTKITISRNFYASFFLTLLGRSHIYECHGIERSKLKSLLQIIIIKRNIAIAISQKLADILQGQSKFANKIHVLHDAASEIDTVDVSSYIENTNRFNVGYFGHLYQGRGIGIIYRLAEIFPELDFYVVGGNEKQINALRNKSQLQNFKVIGFVTNIEARSLMRGLDLLLMPYQRRVSIGVVGSDTSAWMSPLKMFEYMSSGKPIISSKLPVIEEVLIDNYNALLVAPDDLQMWRDAVLRIIKDATLRKNLSKNARNDFMTKYTWEVRARKILNHVD